TVLYRRRTCAGTRYRSPTPDGASSPAATTPWRSTASTSGAAACIWWGPIAPRGAGIPSAKRWYHEAFTHASQSTVEGRDYVRSGNPQRAGRSRVEIRARIFAAVPGAVALHLHDPHHQRRPRTRAAPPASLDHHRRHRPRRRGRGRRRDRRAAGARSGRIVSVLVVVQPENSEGRHARDVSDGVPGRGAFRGGNVAGR